MLRRLNTSLDPLFCLFKDLDYVSAHKHAEKELGQYPAYMTSRLVNNSIIFNFVGECKELCILVGPRENDGTEREAQGVGRDMSCPRNLFLDERKSRFFGGSLFPEMSACSFASLLGS